MVARPLLIVGVAGLLIASPMLVSPALASAARPHGATSDVPPVAERIAATTATFNAIEAKIAAGQSLRARFPDPTAAEDIIDYGVNGLWQKGIDGAGVTVAYVVTNPDPNLVASMTAYDTAMDLPPADITDLALPSPADPSAACQIECSPGEDQLDAEAIHSMAPYAKILFVHPPVPETIGMQGWPQVAQAIKLIADRHLADVITVSLGDGENDFINDPTNATASQQTAVHSLDPAFLDAAAHNIPVTFASGDCGPTAPPVLGSTGQCTPTIGVTADHPSDNPWVTSVGGTIPNGGIATTAGRTAPDALWTARNSNSDAGGAGISTIYPKPSWQRGIAALDGINGRVYPDISLDASDGTSQASPTFAGILALATQLRHGDLGTVNPALAQLGPRGTAAGIVDVPAGFTNTAYNVTGYPTATGYDVASGWGTVFAPDFVPALVKQVDRQRGPAAPSWQARELLSHLQGNVTLSQSKPAKTHGKPTGGTVTVTATGFIPGSTPNGTGVLDGFGVFPPLPGEFGVTSGPFADPTSTVPGQTWDTVTATLTQDGRRHAPGQPLAVTGPDGNGTVTVAIDTNGLAPATYTVRISGLVLTQTATFTVQKDRRTTW